MTIAGAVLSGGIGEVSGATVNGNIVTVDLINVSDAQRITVKILSVNDGLGISDIFIPMIVRAGDVNGNGEVTASDKSQVQVYLGQATTAANFRSDTVPSGLINSSDISVVNLHSGTPFDSPPTPGLVDVTYEHDNDGRVTRLSVPNGGYDLTSIYDDIGRLQTISYLAAQCQIMVTFTTRHQM